MSPRDHNAEVLYRRLDEYIAGTQATRIEFPVVMFQKALWMRAAEPNPHSLSVMDLWLDAHPEIEAVGYTPEGEPPVALINPRGYLIGPFFYFNRGRKAVVGSSAKEES